MPEATNDSLVKEIRETYDYYLDRWKDIYDEGGTDMRYLSGDPWDPKDKAERKDKLPTLAFDELNQYVNQLINDVRQNKRAIKVIPKGSGANDKSAELRGDLLRQIEYESRAQAAYETAFEGGAQRGYGFAGWRKRYVSDRSFDQELQIRRFANPDAVLLDYDAKEWDCSDGMGAFVLDLIPEKQYKSRYPKARITDFGEDVRGTAPNWFRSSSVQVAEFWKVKLKARKLLLFDVPKVGPVAIFADELDRGRPLSGHKLLQEREVEERNVCQYITNGLEVVEENDWDGKYIPIAPCWGREMWLNEGSGAQRIIMSLVRLARDPYMAYCFMRTNEVIEARMTPKVPFIGYKGQFFNKSEWEKAAYEPIAYLQVEPIVDSASGQVLPIPTRPQFQPNFQAYEIACDAMRRAIQAAMGKYNASVGKNDSSVHSGVQQKDLDQQSDQGSFHFIDNYERFLECMGRIGDDLIDPTYDTARDVGTRKMDDSYHVIRINDPNHLDPEDPEETAPHAERRRPRSHDLDRPELPVAARRRRRFRRHHPAKRRAAPAGPGDQRQIPLAHHQASQHGAAGRPDGRAARSGARQPAAGSGASAGQRGAAAETDPGAERRAAEAQAGKGREGHSRPVRRAHGRIRAAGQGLDRGNRHQVSGALGTPGAVRGCDERNPPDAARASDAGDRPAAREGFSHTEHGYPRSCWRTCTIAGVMYRATNNSRMKASTSFAGCAGSNAEYSHSYASMKGPIRRSCGIWR